MQRMMWKAALWLPVLLLALFSKEVFLKAVELGSKYMVHKKLGSTLTFDSLSWKEGKLIVKEGRMRGRVEGAFDQAVWTPAFCLKKRELGGSVEVEHLELSQKQLHAFSNKTKRGFYPIHLNFDVSVPGARLQLADVNLILDVARLDQQLTLSSDLGGQNLSDLYRLVCQLWKVPEPFADWEVIGGELRGELHMSFAKGQLYTLEGRIDATEIKAENPDLLICGSWDKLHVDFDLDLSSSLKVDTWNGTFSLIGGRVALMPGELDFWDGMWDLSKLHSMVSVKNGKVESSFLRGCFFGMEGEIDLDWYSRETLMSLAFQCNSADMPSLLPQKMRIGFQEGFPNDNFAVKATIKRAHEGLLLEGQLALGEKHTLEFGCNFGQETAQGTELPPIGTFADKLKEQFCLSSKRLGWFHGEQFPLEKFFTPFAISDKNLQLSGLVNFEGTFDDRYLVLFYEGENFHFEGSSFDLKIDHINEEVSNDHVAVHYFDMKTGEHEGILPISYAQYTQKRQNVVFEPVSAMAYIQNGSIRFKQIETSWSGLTLCGESKVTMEGFSSVDVDLTISWASGPLEDALELCNYFHPLHFDNPIVGSFETIDDGLVLKYRKGHLEQVRFSADCLASSSLCGLALEEAQFRFDYDRKKNWICFSDAHLHAVYGHAEYPLTFERLSFAPGNWQLQMEGLEGSFVDGVLSVEGFLNASGLWENNHFVLHDFQLSGWRGELDILGSTLQSFRMKCGENELLVSGDLKEFDFAIERVVFDLSTLLPHRLHPWHPQGIFQGKGRFYFDEEFVGEATATFKGLHFGGVRFGDGENLCCSFSQSSGVSIEGLEAAVGDARYKLGGFHYIFAEEKLHFDGFDFAIPAGRLEEVVFVASELFPGKIHSSICEHLAALKPDEELAGRINIELFPNTVWIALSLNDGSYTLFDQKFDLRSFTLVYDPLELNVKTEARYKDSFYWLKFTAQTATLSEGELAIYEEEGKEQLKILWDPGWQVSQICGSIAGCSADLRASGSGDAIDLDGSLAFESRKIVPLLSRKLREMLERISIRGGYKLEGRWHFPKMDPFNPDFFGQIEGRNCGVFQVACNNFSSDLQYCKDTLRLHDFKVIDWSGTMKIHELTMTRDWDLVMEEMTIDNFRLSRLNSPWTDMEKRERPLFRSFCVPHFNLINLRGKLNEPETLTGSGTLFFTNYAKKTLFSNLLQLPTEISARLGLDLTNLIPVKGQVIYTIEDGRVNLLELKDVYSEGKRARFFLADEQPAYIDFDGNVDVKIRMKQYTLLMKIAEFFTFSVKGTIFNPLYTFTNQE